MKRGGRIFVICFLASLSVLAQDSGPSQKPTLGPPPQQPEERPTLKPKNAPDEVTGPDTSSTTDVRKLMRIHTLYIESIDNALSDKLVESIGKWGRFRLVTNPKSADALLRGSCLESKRLKHVHSEIFISDRSGGSIWQDNIYRPYNPPALDQAVADTATLVQQHLALTVRNAERQ